jgi:hypothetical protein
MKRDVSKKHMSISWRGHGLCSSTEMATGGGCCRAQMLFSVTSAMLLWENARGETFHIEVNLYKPC